MNNQTFYDSKWLDIVRKLAIRKTSKYNKILKNTDKLLDLRKIYLTFHKYQRKINASICISYKCKEELLGGTPNGVACHSLFPGTAFARVRCVAGPGEPSA